MPASLYEACFAIITVIVGSRAKQAITVVHAGGWIRRHRVFSCLPPFVRGDGVAARRSGIRRCDPLDLSALGGVRPESAEAVSGVAGWFQQTGGKHAPGDAGQFRLLVDRTRLCRDGADSRNDHQPHQADPGRVRSGADDGGHGCEPDGADAGGWAGSSSSALGNRIGHLRCYDRCVPGCIAGPGGAGG